jgi:hypothetical protein
VKAMQAIHAERKRQIEVEGWTPEHDDRHDDGALLRAAVSYYWNYRDPDMIVKREDGAPMSWPWDVHWWKPKDPRRDLERAGALCLAERERLRRKNARAFCGHVEQKLILIAEALDPLMNN